MKKTLLAAFSVLFGVSIVAQQRAYDGVTINDQGDPQYSTFSLCAIYWHFLLLVWLAVFAVLLFL